MSLHICEAPATDVAWPSFVVIRQTKRKPKRKPERRALRSCTDASLHRGGFGYRSVPPAAAERLEKRCGVRIAGRLCLYEIDDGPLILSLRDKHSQIADAAELVLAARHVERVAC